MSIKRGDHHARIDDIDVELQRPLYLLAAWILANLVHRLDVRLPQIEVQLRIRQPKRRPKKLRVQHTKLQQLSWPVGWIGHRQFAH